MTHLFIIEFQNSDIYYITYSKHITKLKEMLNKYNILTIKDYKKFTITDNFKEHKIHETILFIQNSDFIDYFNYFFKKYQLKNNFYQFNQSIYNEIIEYLNLFKLQPYIPKIIKEKELFECPKCNKSLTSIIYFNRHMESCKGLQCKICNKPFSTVQTYKNHIKNCGQFKCEFCKSIYNSKFKFKKHTQICLKKLKLKNKKKLKKEKNKLPKKSIINTENNNLGKNKLINKIANNIINDILKKI